MKYAIELYFDKETEQKLNQLSQKIADAKISTKFLEWKTRPHLTLACYNDVDENRCIESLKDFAQSHKRMPAYIGSIGMFNDTKTIFASPIMTGSMYQFQRELFESLTEFDTKGWDLYHPVRWFQHCTISLTGEYNEEAFFQASDLVLREFRKISGKFVEIGLVKITVPVEELYTVDLK